MTASLPDGSLDDLLAGVQAAAAEHAARYPGDRGGRQPVHTVYVAADRFTAATAAEWGAEAHRLLDAHAPDRDALPPPSGWTTAGWPPPFVGLRVKSFADGRASAARSARTLDLVVTGLLDRAGGTLPPGLVVTFPKVVAAAHFGVYDYSAACGLPPVEQRLDHPACDFARHLMQVALAGTGVRLADGSTNVVPAGEGTAAAHAAWRRHAGDVRHSLRHGFWQGLDLHPAQLVSRFAAAYAFHLADLDRHAARVAAFAGRGPAVQGILDEPATIRALLGQLRRAVDCGAADEAEVARRVGLDAPALWAVTG